MSHEPTDDPHDDNRHRGGDTMGAQATGASGQVGTSGPPLCEVLDGLTDARCQLCDGHLGPHWGHGPYRQWTRQAVESPRPLPEVSGRAERQPIVPQWSLCYWAAALGVAADQLETLKPADLDVRAPKIVAVMRAAAHWYTTSEQSHATGLDAATVRAEIERLWGEIPLHRKAQLMQEGKGIDPILDRLTRHAAGVE